MCEMQKTSDIAKALMLLSKYLCSYHNFYVHIRTYDTNEIANVLMMFEQEGTGFSNPYQAPGFH